VRRRALVFAALGQVQHFGYWYGWLGGWNPPLRVLPPSVWAHSAGFWPSSVGVLPLSGHAHVAASLSRYPVKFRRWVRSLHATGLQTSALAFRGAALGRVGFGAEFGAHVWRVRAICSLGTRSPAPCVLLLVLWAELGLCARA
jgi:hypothetical protein